MITRLFCLTLMMSTPVVWGGFKEIPLEPTKRIREKIAMNSMNRMAIENDRITQVFGDSESYEVQTEENTGQLFIKPTMENGDRPLSLTLVTEKGVTQDFTLVPSEGEAATLILKGSGDAKETSKETKKTVANSLGDSMPSSESMPWKVSSGFADRAMGFQDKLLTLMKQLVARAFPSVEETGHIKQRTRAGLGIHLTQLSDLGGLSGCVFEIKNETDTVMEVSEKDFYEQGDLALSLEKRALKSGESTPLYVVSRV